MIDPIGSSEAGAEATERSRAPIFFMGFGLFVCIAALLWAVRYNSCLSNAVAQARAAGFILDVRRTRVNESTVGWTPAALCAAWDRIREDPRFVESKDQVLEEVPKQIDLNGFGAPHESATDADELFRVFDRPNPPIPDGGIEIDLRGSEAFMMMELISQGACDHLEKRDLEGSNRAIARLFVIASALRESVDGQNAEMRLKAIERACILMLGLLPSHPNPEAWVRDTLRDDGQGTWYRYQEGEVTKLLEASDPTLVHSTTPMRRSVPNYLRNAFDRILWPERLSALIQLSAQSRRIVDSGAPDAVARIRKLEKEYKSETIWKLSSSFSRSVDVLALENKVRSDAALVRAAARVLEQVRRASFDSADPNALARDLPNDTETNLPFLVKRIDDALVVMNTTRSRYFRITRDALGGK